MEMDLTAGNISLTLSDAPPQAAERLISAVSFSTIFAASLAGNGLAAYTVLATPTMWNACMLVMCSSYIANFVCSLFAGLLNVQAAWRSDWSYPTWYCRLYVFWTGWLGLCSVNLLTAAAVLRCRWVVANRGLSVKAAVRLIVGLAAASLAWTLPAVVGGDSKVVAVRAVSTCALNWSSRNSSDRAYWFCLLVGQFLVPLGVICVSYGRIFSHLRKLRRTSSLFSGQPSALTRNRMERDKRLTIHILVVILAFLLCWTPYSLMAVHALLTRVDLSGWFYRNLSRLTILLAKGSMAASAGANFAVNADFRRALRATRLCRGFGCALTDSHRDRESESPLQVIKSSSACAEHLMLVEKDKMDTNM